MFKQSGESSCIRVVVVDDHPLYRDGIISAISRAGSGVRVEAEAGTVTEAVRLTLEHQPDIVLMDLRLPDGDGAEATRRLRTLCPGSRVIIITGVHDATALSSAMSAGAAGVLTKDASGAEIVAGIHSVMAGGAVFSASIARLLAAPRPTGGRDGQMRLSERERQVLSRLAIGQSNRQIALELVVSVRTIDNHVRSIYSKLGVHDRVQAAISAARLGIVSFDQSSRGG